VNLTDKVTGSIFISASAKDITTLPVKRDGRSTPYPLNKSKPKSQMQKNALKELREGSDE
jgi:hypothetical protein